MKHARETAAHKKNEQVILLIFQTGEFVMSKVRSLTVVLVISLLLQPIFPLLAMSSNHPVEKSAPVAANEYLARDGVAEAPAAPVMATLPDRPYLPVIYKTGSAMSALAPNAPASMLPAVSASQVITNGEDIVYLVNHEQIGRTRNFSAISPTWSLVTTMTTGPAGTLGLNAIYDFALDPSDPYHKAWAVGDTGIWKTTNLNADTPSWDLVKSTFDITTTIIGQGGRLAPDSPNNPGIKGISHIVGDVSRPGYFFVAVGNNGGCTEPDPITGKYAHSYVGRTFNSGETWSWHEVPNGWCGGTPGKSYLGTIKPYGGPTGLAVSQDGSARIWLGAFNEPEANRNSFLLHSDDYGGTWQTIWYTQAIGAPRTLYYAQGSLFMIIDPDHGMKTTLIGKSTDGGRTWTFLPKTQEPTPQWRAYRYILQGVPQTDQLLYYSAGTDSFGNNSFQRSFDGAGTFITYTQPFVLNNVSQFAAAPTVWIDNPERILIPRLGVVSAGSADRVVVFSVDGGISWQDKTGYWKSQIGGWSGPNHGELVRAFLPSQVARQRDQSLRDLSRRGKETDCALSCAPPVHWVNDPIDTSNGNMSYQVTDLSVASLGGNLTFQRSYASVDSNVPRSLGYGWANNFDSRIIAPAATAHPVTLTLQTGNGSLLQFFRVVSTTSTGTYAPDLGVTAALTRVVAGNIVTYTMVDKLQTTYVFTTSGAMLSKRSSLGYLTTFSYTLPNTLTQVTDVSTGRWLKFTYDQGRLKTVFDHSGRTITFTYNITGDLTSLIDVRGLTWTYVYTGSHLLWKVIDPDQRTVIRTEYDAQGRAVAQYDGLDNRTVKLDFGLGSTTILTDARNLTSTDTYVGGTWIGSLDANSRPITRNYDLNFRPVNLADQNGNSSRMLWSPDGNNLNQIVDAGGYTTTMQYDGLNNLKVITDARGFTTTFTYSGTFLTRKVDALGNTWIYTPTSDGRNLLSKMQDARGNVTAYGYDTLGQRVVMTDALNNVTRYGYDEIGRLISTTVNADQPAYERTSLNRYDGAGNLISTTVNFNPNANADPRLYNLTTLYAYDSAGRQIAITDTIGRITRNYYNDAGQLVLTTANFTTTPGVDPNLYNLTTRYGYDAVGNRVLVTDTRNLVTKTDFDNLNRPITVTTNYVNGFYDPAKPDEDLAHVTHYDPAGNVIEQIEMSANGALDRVTRTWYDNLNRPITVTRNFVDGIYNAAQPDLDLTTVTTYDAAGNAIKSLDPLNHPAWFRYDELNRLISTTNALSGTTLTRYDAVGNRMLVTDVLTHAIRYEYDKLNRLITTTFPYTGWVVNTYDPMGNRTRVTDALGHATVYTYNLRGQLIAQTDAMGGTTRYEYDRIGNRVAMTDANGVVTRYTYDIQSRLLSVTENYSLTGPIDSQTNVSTSYGYDKVGNRTVMTNARGFTTTYTYDAVSRLIAMRDPLSHTVEYQYDALGNHAVMTDANRTVTLYGYDKANRLLVITYTAEAKTVRYAYDALGNRTVMTDSLGVTRYQYDDLNRLKQVADPFNQTITYTYDLAGNRTGLKYPDGKIVTYTFDANNRLTRTLSWDGQATAYFYDRAGRLITTTWPNGLTTLYRYDDAGRLLNMTHVGHWVLATYTYTLDALSNRLAVIERVLPPTPLIYLPVIMKDFDGSGEQMMPGERTTPFVSPLAVPAPFQSPLPTPTTTGSASIPASPISDLTLLVMTPTVLAALVGRRKKGQKWTLPLAVLAGALITVGLTQTSGATPAPMPFLSPQSPPPGCTLPNAIGDMRVISYTYDPLYRLSQAAYSSGECYQYAYDRVGNRAAMTTTVGTTTYQYDNANRLSSVDGQTYTWDDNGNLLNDGSALYRYDQANRLISTTLSSTTSLFNYNGDGARLKQVVAGVVTTYTQDLAAPLPVVLQAKAGSATTQYIYALSTRPLAENAGSWEYLMPDALGSVRQIADASGNIIRTQDYKPYGSALNSNGSGQSTYVRAVIGSCTF
jgi:YD repeat-containing protein